MPQANKIKNSGGFPLAGDMNPVRRTLDPERPVVNDTIETCAQCQTIVRVYSS